MRNAKERWLIAYLAVGYLAFAELLSLPGSQWSPPCLLVSQYQPENHQAGYYSCATLHEGVWRGLVFLSDYFTTNNINTAATVCIALFTLTLWWSTRSLFRVTTSTLNLARDEFAAAHRPKIVVHLAELKRFPDPSAPGGSQLDQLGITVLCFNKGRGTAKNVEVRGDFIASSHLPDPKVMRAMIEPPIESLASGIKIWFEANSERPIINMVGFKHQGVHAYFIGVIVYFDGNDRRRETGFCFIFDAPSMCWQSVGSPQHEYAY